MKTSVNIIRQMGQFDVIQRTSDGKFNASDLLQKWNKEKGQQKKLVVFFGLEQTKTFIDELEKDIETHSKESYDGGFKAINEIKGRNTKNGRTSDVVWVHPYLYIKFAMWLNPRFELQVIKFVHDQLVAFRNDAGDGYNGLTTAVQRFANIDYRTLAKGLNWIVFGRHENGIRNSASQEQLRELTELQKNLAFACDLGYIKTFDELINEMRRLYHKKAHYSL